MARDSRKTHPRRPAQKARVARKATTFRFDPAAQEGLALLGRISKTPLNRLVNEAVVEYLHGRLAAAEGDLEQVLARIREYRRRDPGFEAAIRKFAESEAGGAAEDSVEGKTAPAAGPVHGLVRGLLNGGLGR